MLTPVLYFRELLRCSPDDWPDQNLKLEDPRVFGCLAQAEEAAYPWRGLKASRAIIRGYTKIESACRIPLS